MLDLLTVCLGLESHHYGTVYLHLTFLSRDRHGVVKKIRERFLQAGRDTLRSVSRRTALVLSAGGMFGAYQSGVWKSLASEFRPDIVVGSSVGTLNGWAIAGGCSPEDLISQWLDPRTAALMKIHFPFLPWKGIFDPRGLEAKAKELYSRYTPLVPFGAVVAELPRLRARLFREEEITWRHLMASCAIAGGYPQVRLDGRLYSDGGLLSFLPVWAAGEMGASLVIAVNAMPVFPSRLIRAAICVARQFGKTPGVPEGLEVVTVVPSRPMGSLKDMIHWNKDNVRRWIAMGESDARKLLPRVVK